MKAVKRVLLISSVLLVLFCAFSSEKALSSNENRIAVLDIETTGIDITVVRPLSDSIRFELINMGKFDVIDRNNMTKVFNEQKFQSAVCSSKTCAVEAGQLLGVGKIILGSASKVGNYYYLSLMLVNVATGKIEKASEDMCLKCDTNDLLFSGKGLIKKMFMEKEGAADSISEKLSELRRIKDENLRFGQLEIYANMIGGVPKQGKDCSQYVHFLMSLVTSHDSIKREILGAATIEEAFTFCNSNNDEVTVCKKLYEEPTIQEAGGIKELFSPKACFQRNKRCDYGHGLIVLKEGSYKLKIKGKAAYQTWPLSKESVVFDKENDEAIVIKGGQKLTLIVKFQAEDGRYSVESRYLMQN